MQPPADKSRQSPELKSAWWHSWWMALVAFIVGAVALYCRIIFEPPGPHAIFVGGQRGGELIQPVRVYLVPEALTVFLAVSCAAFTVALLCIVASLASTEQSKRIAASSVVVMGILFLLSAIAVYAVFGPKISRYEDSVTMVWGFGATTCIAFDADGIWMTPTNDFCIE